ncbi:aldo/keto reductase [Micromonospora endophytica]|uniref:Aldo/keto reductase n=1 Tax=Micromonospora endophytica TaxID=515350 RepID=A0A2W2CND5_9ACTN|nr:aldo/keto reductase [Micromonospora endophytica]PZG01012.1 aldo/keto reductase [Micromonospora endophytica]RIW47947.1 aldo/keto reductase [Micromonospora endophytica]
MTCVRLGRSTVAVSRLGLGCAQLGNLYQVIDDAEADATVAAAWDCGIRYFDTAPHYGLGLSERRLGAALRNRPRDAYTISTKVGRLLVPDPAGAGRRDPEGFQVPADHRRVWDFSADGVRRSLEASLTRLGLDRIDLVLVHDPEGHQSAALTQAYPALHELRAQGTIGAIGVGSKDWPVLHRFVTETDIDAVMLAGRHTLLAQPALATLLPECQRRGVSVLNVGVFNSGLLAEARPHTGLHYDYAQVPPPVWDRVQAIVAVCDRHGTTLPAAALAYAAAHPAVAAVVVGADHPDQVRRNAALLAAPPPPATFWSDLVSAGLLQGGAPY